MAAASLVLAVGAAGIAALAIDRTPVVDAQVVWADAPRRYAPLESHVVLAAATPAPAAPEKDAAPVSPIVSEAYGHDSHVANPIAWPVYSPRDAAAAFPKSGAELIVKPAEFRPSSSVYTAGPVLVRH